MAIYSDFDLRMTQHPYSKDVVRLDDADAIKASIRNIVMTNRYERRFNLFFGGNIRNYLFENSNFLERETMKEEIISKIMEFEPRIYNVSIKSINESDNTISFKIIYTIKNTVIPNTIDLIIYRTR